MILYLQYGSSTVNPITLDLVASDISTEEILPGAFATTGQEVSQTTIRVTIEGRPNIYEASTKIGDMITQCQIDNGRAIGNRVYLHYQPANQSTVWRARVIALAFTPDPSSGQYWKVQRHIKGEFTVIHRIWEGALTQIPLTNANGTDILDGLEVDNAQDATHTNEVLINSEDVTGDCPTPAMIVCENTYDNAATLGRILIGQNINCSPANWQQVWEAEDATGTGGDVVDATCSAGKYTRLTAAATFIFWSMTANDIAYALGNQFHAILRAGPNAAGSDTEDFYFYLYMTNGGEILPIWLSDPIYPGAGYFNYENMGVIRIPPWRVNENLYTTAMDLYMLIYTQDGTVKDCDLDAIYLWPVDGYRDLQMFAGLNADYKDRVVDDMIEEELYLDSGVGTGRTHTIVPFGSRIMLQPGKDQKLYFLQEQFGFNTNSGIVRTMDIWVYYRPRRLAL